MATTPKKLFWLKQDLAICKLPADSPLPEWLNESSFYSVTRTEAELSIVCDFDKVTDFADAQEQWRGFGFEGTLDFSLVGVISKVSAILAQDAISLFAISTFDTDYVLVRADDFERVEKLLTESGYKIR